LKNDLQTTLLAVSDISAHPTMTRAPRRAKRAKIIAHKPKHLNLGAGSASLFVVAPTRTRRGKIVYKEVDAAPLFELSDKDKGGESPKKTSMTPSNSGTAIPPSLEEASSFDNQEPHVPRITKVRLKL